MPVTTSAGAAEEKGKGTNPTPGRALSRTATHLVEDGVDRQPDPGGPYRRIASIATLPPCQPRSASRIDPPSRLSTPAPGGRIR